jgi:hypothetical protein
VIPFVLAILANNLRNGHNTHSIGYCTLDNAANNDTAVRSLGELYNFERRLRCSLHFIHLTVQVMIYGYGSKAIDIRELLGHHGDRDFGNDENTDSEASDGDGGNDSDDNAFFNAIDQLGFDSSLEGEDADSMAEDDDYDTQIPAIAASIPTHITTITGTLSGNSCISRRPHLIFERTSLSQNTLN